MLKSNWRQRIFTALVVLLAMPVLGVGPVRDGERHRVPDGAFNVLERASLRTPVEIRGIPLQHGLVETILVQEFQLLDPGARLHVTDENGVERIEAFPEMRFFKGEVLGKPGSWVSLTESEHGVGGLVSVDEEMYSVERGEGKSLESYYTRRVDNEELPEAVRNWTCEADAYRVPEIHRERVAAASTLAPVTANAFATSTKRRLKIAVDTDGELTSLVGSTANVATYVASVTAAVSVLYENDLNTVLSLGDVFTYANAGADPWTATIDNGTLLDELGTYWHVTPARSSIGRSTVLLISGKDTGGGVAWISVLCRDTDFETAQDSGIWGGGYGMWGGVAGTVSTSPTQPGYWDVLAYAHELGHNANSEHTHCISSTGYGRSYVDECRSGEGAGCYSGTQTVPPEKGTIMSYCHLLTGGYSNVRLIFGKAGEASEAVLPPMTTHINGVTFSAPMMSSTETVGSGSTGNTASVSAPGATTYVWEVTNGTITAGQGTSSVTYTAGTTGTVEIKVTAANAKGCGMIATGTVDISGGGGGVDADFNGDGKPDIVWRNFATGKNAAWHMDGATRSGYLYFPTLNDANWVIVGTGDFNGDGKEDLVWRHKTNGKNAIWYMDGATRSGYAYMPTLPDTNWYVGGVADFNGDDKPDLVWRHATTGQNAIWYMNNATRSSYAYLPTLGDNNWKIVGADDFNLDGKPDLVWRNTSTGQNSLWYLNNASFLAAAYMPPLADLTWEIVGVGDYNANGKPDLVWRNTGNGQNAFWYMNDNSRTGYDYILTLADQNWKIQGPR